MNHIRIVLVVGGALAVLVVVALLWVYSGKSDGGNAAPAPQLPPTTNNTAPESPAVTPRPGPLLPGGTTAAGLFRGQYGGLMQLRPPPV
ncbi:MAG: hypothetical protein BroJett014_21400 [Planctomycetota bacterium]|nr:MAG: hypothetical protein BroJett014_21400 [Planctomycetota bacterium]